MKPFLKWAGGKRWLTYRLRDLNEVKFDRYVEPFLGSGAVFFHLLPKKAILSDSNKKLIESYVALKNNSTRVVDLLRLHEFNHSHEYYYHVRDMKFENCIEAAAQFIYLNRTCWNGLYRESLAGKFNVPKGTKSKVFYDDDNFDAIGISLKNANLKCCDFEQIINEARRGDLIFVDPPYTVRHNNNGFVKYNERIFSWEDQIRLRDSVGKAKSRGAFLIITNAFHPSIIDLYFDLGEIIPLERHSVLSGDKNYRSPTQEALVLVNLTMSDVLTEDKSRQYFAVSSKFSAVV